jgi:hypothetical protein
MLALVDMANLAAMVNVTHHVHRVLQTLIAAAVVHHAPARMLHYRNGACGLK